MFHTTNNKHYALYTVLDGPVRFRQAEFSSNDLQGVIKRIINMMRSRKNFYVPTFLATMLLLSSCRTMKPSRGALLEDQIPAHFSQETNGVEYSVKWWKDFNSNQLNDLMQKAFNGNLSIEQAAARLEQAAAVARKSHAGIIPDFSIQAKSTHSDHNVQGAGTKTFQSLGLYASYEVDLWGRIKSIRRAAGAQFEASSFDMQTIAMMISAELAETYFNWLAQNRGLAIYKSQLKSSLEKLEVLEQRYNTGQSTSLAVLQQRQRVAAAEAKLPPVQSAIKSLELSIAVLLGKAPGTNLDLVVEPLPKMPALPALGLPVDVIQNRPDVQSARLNLEAADWNVGAASAARLPAITLTGSLATSGEDLNNLFDDWVSNLAAGLLGPIIDGGARKAEVDRTLAVARERIAKYRLTVLNAVKETEDSLNREQHQTEYVAAVKKQLVAARKTETESIRRYQRGSLPYLDTLAAITSRESLEIALVKAQATLLADRIQLYRSLGGNWSSILKEL